MDEEFDSTIPFVRCLTCNKLIGHLYEAYIEHKKKYPDDIESFFNLPSVNLTRWCCRANLANPIAIPMGTSYVSGAAIERELNIGVDKLRQERLQQNEHHALECALKYIPKRPRRLREATPEELDKLKIRTYIAR